MGGVDGNGVGGVVGGRAGGGVMDDLLVGRLGFWEGLSARRSTGLLAQFL